MKKIALIDLVLLILVITSMQLFKSQNQVTLINNPLYQPILKSISNSSNIVSIVSGLTIVSSKNIYNNYYLVNINNKTKTDGAILIIEKNNNGYRVVLGPGTKFTKSSASNLPAGLYRVLLSEGLIG